MSSIHPDERTLESWKEIAAYLRRDAKTARNWEKSEGLPVHRHTHNRRSSVYAYRSEIDAWRAGRRVAAELAPVPPAEVRPWWRQLAIGTATLLFLMMAGNGVRPQVVSAQGLRQSARQIWNGPVAGGALNGSLSADGQYLTFTNWDTGDLGVRNLTTGTDRLLTNSGGWENSGDYTEQSVISPNGREIAYHWFTEKNLRDEIRIVSVDGSTPRTVYRTTDSSEHVLPYGWTRDGRQLLVLQSLPDRTSRIVLLSAADGSMLALKSVPWSFPQAALSPDGRYIAYESRAGNAPRARDIFVLPTDGGRETAAIQSPADDYSPFWSPDGTKLLFMSDRTGIPSLWDVPITGGKPSGPAQLVRDNMGDSSLKPLGMASDGALYYVRPGGGRTNLYTVDLNAAMKASTPPAIATDRFVNSNLGPAWSPDGQKLAYYSARGSSFALMIRDLKTGEEREINARLSLQPHFRSGPKWFPDGRSVLVGAGEPQRAVISFYRVELASGKAELLWRPGKALQGYALSPDGKAIFASEMTDSDPEITTRLVRFDVKARTENELKRGVWFIELAVSPDSKKLAYLVSVRPGAASYLGVMPVNGGATREVFRGSPWIDGSRYSALSWTPDGKSLVFVRGGSAEHDSALWRVSLSGGPAQPLGISFRGQVKGPAIHPDGRRLVFGGADNADGEVWALENFLPEFARK